MSEHHGVVYTKEWVVDLILDIAEYKESEPILDRVLCEPSCGCGSFLRSICDRLAIAAHRERRFSVEGLKPCVVAFDIDSDSVSESRKVVVSSLMSWGMNEFEAAEVAHTWVRCEDYLLADLVACDYVVGNPPYLRASDIDPASRLAYCSAIESMTKGCDLFIGFIQRGLDSLREGGSLTYICADRWLQNQYGQLLRKYIVESGFFINNLIRMYGVDAFDSEVDAYPSITKISKRVSGIRYADCKPSFDSSDVAELSAWLNSEGDCYNSRNFSACLMPARTDGSMVPLASPEKARLIASLSEEFPSIEEAGVKIGIGLATGRDKVFIVDSPDVVEEERMLPVFSMRDHRRKTGKSRWLVNPWTPDNELVDLDGYPRMRAYFESHREDLERRHVAKKSGAYYRTIDKPNWGIYGREMLLFPDMAAKADPVWSDGSRYPCHNCYWLISEEWGLKSLAGLLMSDIAEAFIDALGVKMRGDTLRFQAQYLRLIHIPYPHEVSAEVKAELSSAYESKNREAANIAARKAYGLWMTE